MTYTISVAQIEDISAMYDVSQAAHMSELYDTLIPAEQRSAFDVHYQKSAKNRQRFITTLGNRLAGEAWQAFVAKDDRDRVVGFTLRQYVSPQKLVLKSLFVMPAMQYQGIGEALFLRSFADAESGCKIELTVVAANTRAKHLYEKHGFRVAGEAETQFYGASQEVMTRLVH